VNLTAENTAIVLDSTADFPVAPDRFPNWRVVPLYVRFGAESYRDYVDIGPADFYERLRTSDELPTTSQPTPQDFLAAYQELGGYERVFSLHVSAKLSGTFASAESAAAESGDRVRVIDTATASAAIAMLGLAIQRRLEAGTTNEEVDALVDRFKRESGIIFTLDTLEFLARGGRIGRASSWAGQLLHIKPVLTLAEGEVLPIKRVRGNRKAIQEFASAFKEGTAGGPGLRVGIAHAEAPERMAALKELVRDIRPEAEIEVVTTLGPVVGTHAGPGTVGLFWLQDREEEGPRD
jgi:DegV family protein with EDD domain